MKKANGGVCVYSCAFFVLTKIVSRLSVYSYFMSIIISYTGEEAHQWFRKLFWQYYIYGKNINLL